MLRIEIENQLKEKGITPYALAVKTGLSTNQVYNIIGNKTKSVSFETLEKICIELDCTPNDILISNNPNYLKISK